MKLWPKVIIFDCDGVLVDSEILSLSETRDALAAQGLALTFEETRTRFMGLSGRTMLERVQREISHRLPDDFHAQLTRRIVERFQTELRPIAGVREALAAARARVCVASSSTPERIRRSLEIVGYAELFAPHLFSASEVERGKPFPDLFLHAARAMDVAPGDCLVVEDSVPGVTAATRAGIPVFGFTGGSHLKGAGQEAVLRAAGAALTFSAMQDIGPLIQRHREQVAAQDQAALAL